MGTWKEYIENLKKQWIGKKVSYMGSTYNVVDIDYNSMLLIDKKASHTDTTAVSYAHID